MFTCLSRSIPHGKGLGDAHSSRESGIGKRTRWKSNEFVSFDRRITVNEGWAEWSGVMASCD